MIKYRNYQLRKFNDLNWTVERKDTITAKKDITAVGNPKEIVHKKGDVYQAYINIGYFPDVGSALSRIVGDLAGTDCETIEELATQIKGIKKDLWSLVRDVKLP